jgi:hypothetical protein
VTDASIRPSEPFVSCEASFMASVSPENHVVTPAPAGTRIASPEAVHGLGSGWESEMLMMNSLIAAR